MPDQNCCRIPEDETRGLYFCTLDRNGTIDAILASEMNAGDWGLPLAYCLVEAQSQIGALAYARELFDDRLPAFGAPSQG